MALFPQFLQITSKLVHNPPTELLSFPIWQLLESIFFMLLLTDYYIATREDFGSE